MSFPYCSCCVLDAWHKLVATLYLYRLFFGIASTVFNSNTTCCYIYKVLCTYTNNKLHRKVFIVLLFFCTRWHTVTLASKLKRLALAVAFMSLSSSWFYQIITKGQTRKGQEGRTNFLLFFFTFFAQNSIWPVSWAHTSQIYLLAHIMQLKNRVRLAVWANNTTGL